MKQRLLVSKTRHKSQQEVKWLLYFIVSAIMFGMVGFQNDTSLFLKIIIGCLFFISGFMHFVVYKIEDES